MKSLIVISGGDAPGINTFLYRFATLAESAGHSVVGAQGSFRGLLNNQVVPLTSRALMPWSTQPGSYLASDRAPALTNHGAETALKARLAEHAIDSVVLLGGNGSLRHSLPRLAEWGIPCVGVPATIDNDVPGSHVTLGFDSACVHAHHAIDGLLATAHALPGRLFAVETLGGSTGFLALEVASAAGAHAVLIPEYEADSDWLHVRMQDAVRRHGFGLVVRSEGVKHSDILADTLELGTGIRVRDTRLGHAMRGAWPSHRDRWLATEMAVDAYQALRRGVPLGVLLVHGSKVWFLEDTISGFPDLPPERALYDRVNGLGDWD